MGLTSSARREPAIDYVFVKDVKFAHREAHRDFGLYSLCYYSTSSTARRQAGDSPKIGTMRRKPTQRQLWMLALALLALLPLLAALQYHWLGQVSEGERERMKSVLTTMARQFCHDFDSELTNIFLYFQPTPIPAGGKTDQSQYDFAARYRRWRETASHPKLIKEVYQT